MLADVTLGEVEALELAIPDTFWTHEMSPAVLAAWENQNAFGRQYYEEITKPHRRARRARRARLPR